MTIYFIHKNVPRYYNILTDISQNDTCVKIRRAKLGATQRKNKVTTPKYEFIHEQKKKTLKI